MRTVPFAEADLVVTLFTQALGHLAAIAPRARSTSPKNRRILEPMHTLDVVLRDRPAGALLSLVSSQIARPRLGILSDLDRMKTAGTVLRWVRQTAPYRTSETDLWKLIEELLDALDQTALRASPRALLVVAGFRLLECLGYGLDLGACVVCGRPCPPERPAFVDPVRGGLVCRRCGGAGRLLSGAIRQRMLLALQGQAEVLEQDIAPLLGLLEAALVAHTNIRPEGAEAISR